MTCNFYGYYEIRVQGHKNVHYEVNFYQYSNYKMHIKNKTFYKNSNIKNREVFSNTFKLDLGTYAVEIVPSVGYGQAN